MRYFLLTLLACLFGGATPSFGALPRIQISDDGRYFAAASSDKPFTIWGVNYDHDAGQQRLLEDYWHTEWETVQEDFSEIKALGANLVRIHLQLGRFMKSPTEPDAANLKKLGELIALSDQTGLYLDITGLSCYHKQDVPPWYDALSTPDRWAVQARFWKAVAAVGAGHPAVFCYDLMNEPILPGAKKDETEWLAGELGGKYFVQRLALSLGEQSRAELARDWIKQMTDAIHEVDPKTLVTLGVIPWAHTWPKAKPIFYAEGVGDPLDFVSVHFYPRKGEVQRALDALKVYELGKPLIVEEMFPLKCGMDEMKTFIEGSRPFCDGWVSFYWGKTAEDYAAEEPKTIKGAIVGQWLKAFRDWAPKNPSPGQ